MLQNGQRDHCIIAIVHPVRKGRADIAQNIRAGQVLVLGINVVQVQAFGTPGDFATQAERDYIVEARKPKTTGANSDSEEEPITFAEMLRSPNMLMLMVQSKE